MMHGSPHLFQVFESLLSQREDQGAFGTKQG
jgi:hypothetical protein